MGEGKNRLDATVPVAVSKASPRPWYFDGWDIFTTGPTTETGGHRLVVPLPHDTFHPSQRVKDADAELIVRAVNEYDALIELERNLRGYLRTLTMPAADYANADYSLHVDEALARLDELRALTTEPAPQATPPSTASKDDGSGGGCG